MTTIFSDITFKMTEKYISAIAHTHWVDFFPSITFLSFTVSCFYFQGWRSLLYFSDTLNMFIIQTASKCSMNSVSLSANSICWVCQSFISLDFLKYMVIKLIVTHICSTAYSFWTAASWSRHEPHQVNSTTYVSSISNGSHELQGLLPSYFPLFWWEIHFSFLFVDSSLSYFPAWYILIYFNNGSVVSEFDRYGGDKVWM